MHPVATRDETVILPWAVRIEQDGRFKHANPVRGSLPLSNFDGNGSDLLYIIDAYIRGLYLLRLVKRDDEHFGRPNQIVRAGRHIAMNMKGGTSGRERDIRLSSKRADERLERSGIVWSTYGMYVAIPVNSQVGWVLVEKNSSDSIPGAWRKDFIKQFRSLFPKYVLTFSQVRMDSTWQLIEKGKAQRISSVEVARRDAGLTSDQSTRGFPRNVTKARQDVYFDPSGSMAAEAVKRLRRLFTVAKDGQGVVEIDLADEQDDFAEGLAIELRHDVIEITVHARINGRSKTVRFSGGAEPIETYVVEGSGNARVSGPTFQSECRGHIKDLANASGVSLAAGWDTGRWPTVPPVATLEVRPSDSH
jgi:hypothetical protein